MIRELFATLCCLACAVSSSGERLHLLVVGAHPDDPETGAGGLIANWSAAGHRVTIAYLTTGEAGIPGVPHDEAAQIRRQEALQAAKILGAEAVFIGQVDGDTFINNKARQGFEVLISELAPDLIVTHWLIDAHRDHQVCGTMTYDAWYRNGSKQPLYFYEVLSGIQTQLFHPTHFLDITATIETKRSSCYAHASQLTPGDYADDHAVMEVFRGFQANTRFGEAYVRHPLSPETGVTLQGRVPGPPKDETTNSQ